MEKRQQKKKKMKKNSTHEQNEQHFSSNKNNKSKQALNKYAHTHTHMCINKSCISNNHPRSSMFLMLKTTMFSNTSSTNKSHIHEHMHSNSAIPLQRIEQHNNAIHTAYTCDH